MCCGITSVVVPEGCTVIGADAFAGCGGLTTIVLPISRLAHSEATAVASRLPSCTSGLVGTLVGGVTVVEDTAPNRRRALDLQYWRVSTHWLCSPTRRSWVLRVLRVANRLRGGPLALPHEMWDGILGAIRRGELGPGRCTSHRHVQPCTAFN
jgi:hypothetical protein